MKNKLNSEKIIRVRKKYRDRPNQAIIDDLDYLETRIYLLRMEARRLTDKSEYLRNLMDERLCKTKFPTDDHTTHTNQTK